ncbi:MAG: malate/lactate/ureidoglycolate dehydrogenase [Pseudomonadota bacterium]|nr:malate/lactate/ureidoglycolate dehydrogenase [Pseudomonadota bacterium]
MPAIAADRLEALGARIIAAGGSDAAEARTVAFRLVEANLLGHDSHGIGMIPAYVNALQNGRLRPGRHVSELRRDGPMVLLDGHVGYGQVIGAEAMEIAIATARDHGLCLLSLRNSHHLGRIGAWGEMAADAGFISVHWVNVVARMPAVAPFGGADARFSTNPYCTAVPATASHPRFVLDMATTKVAMGKVRVAHNTGTQVPTEALIGPDGVMTTDPGVMFREPRGALLSMGLHKGYGLAMVCEILAGALSGGGTGLPEHSDGASIINNMTALVVDPGRLADRSAMMAEVDSFIGYVKQSPPAPGVDRVMIAGDPERAAREARLANGIEVDDTTFGELLAAGTALGVSAAEIGALAGQQ